MVKRKRIMKKLAITDPAQIEEIIRKCTFCSVGITDLQGNPYVIPMEKQE